jgi:lipopolysaccharide transport system ATP-binding protein
MLDEPIIQVKNLSKQYDINKAIVNTTLRDSLVNTFKQPLKIFKKHRSNMETFWALNNVNFDVMKGDVLGIIGKNGAGKSTLLKILSRITYPTEGSILMDGRVGSLLEVGTGFHYELTGRENIYFNGALLGMKHKEINDKFDEIVKFSGVEAFLDTPVKRYSSGMAVRLAFSVAAHLEPEILVIDEVLAVGDAVFQKKCIGKMSEAAESGKTVLFVSHNIEAIKKLCTSSLVLDGGKTIFNGDLDKGIEAYFQNIQMQQTKQLSERKDRRGDQSLKFTHVEFFDNNNNEIDHLTTGDDVHIRLYYTAKENINDATVSVAFNIMSPSGNVLTNLVSSDSSNIKMNIYTSGYFECSWSKLNLREGTYDCNLYCAINNNVVDWIQSAFKLNIEYGDYFGLGAGSMTTTINRMTNDGDILISHKWESKR